MVEHEAVNDEEEQVDEHINEFIRKFKPTRSLCFKRLSLKSWLLLITFYDVAISCWAVFNLTNYETLWNKQEDKFKEEFQDKFEMYEDISIYQINH